MIKSQKGKPNLRALNRTMSASASDELFRNVKVTRKYAICYQQESAYVIASAICALCYISCSFFQSCCVVDVCVRNCFHRPFLGCSLQQVCIQQFIDL